MKFLKWSLLSLVLIIIIAVTIVWLNLNRIVRSTVETNLNLNDSDPVIHTTPSTPEPATTATATTLPSELEPTHASGDDSVAPAPAVDIGEPYCAQRGSRLFHRRECAWVPRVKEADRVYLKRVADARDQGFVECPVCVPWEPA